MKRRLAFTTGLPLMIVLALLVATAGPAMAQAQVTTTRYNLSPDAGPFSSRVAYPSTNDPNPPEPLPLSLGLVIKHCDVWVANDPALVGVEIPPQQVTYNLRFLVLAHIEGITVELGKRTTDGTFVGTEPPTRQTTDLALALPEFNPDIAGSIESPGLLILPGEWLAFEVCIEFLPNVEPDVMGAAILKTTNGVSWFELTIRIPEIPIPELGTVFLSGAGLGLVALGLVVRQRRKI